MRSAIPPLPRYFLRAWCLVKHKENFTFTFTFMEFDIKMTVVSRNIQQMSQFLCPLPVLSKLSYRERDSLSSGSFTLNQARTDKIVITPRDNSGSVCVIWLVVPDGARGCMCHDYNV
jgi:hypothetical protein